MFHVKMKCSYRNKTLTGVHIVTTIPPLVIFLMKQLTASAEGTGRGIFLEASGEGDKVPFFLAMLVCQGDLMSMCCFDDRGTDTRSSLRFRFHFSLALAALSLEPIQFPRPRRRVGAAGREVSPEEREQEQQATG